jgi:transposase
VFYRSLDNGANSGFGRNGTKPLFQRVDGSRPGVSKAGSPMVRTTTIELTWLWLRYQPGSVLSVRFRERVGDRKGRVRRIAIVAMARKLLVALWRSLGVASTSAEFKPN